MVEVHGSCDPRFAAVKEAFADNFERFDEVGATVAATVDGKPVVDLWAGHADLSRTRPWERDTITLLYSVSKGVTSLCGHMLVDRGLLDLDAPVVKYWPEFGQEGKDEMPVRYLLGQQAGLHQIDLQLADFLDRAKVVKAIEEQKPLYEPGTAHTYHAMTYGAFIGELVLRITGESLGTFIRKEVTGPLGADYFLGFGAELDPRVADLVPATSSKPTVTLELTGEDFKYLEALTTRQGRALEDGSANGYGNARGVARIYSALACGGEVDGIRLLSPEALAQATEEVHVPWYSEGEAVVGMNETRMTLGWVLSSGLYLGPNPRAFGFAGLGGGLGFADPDARLSFAYAMNKMRVGEANDPRRAPLIDALYASL